MLTRTQLWRRAKTPKAGGDRSLPWNNPREQISPRRDSSSSPPRQSGDDKSTTKTNINNNNNNNNIFAIGEKYKEVGEAKFIIGSSGSECGDETRISSDSLLKLSMEAEPKSAPLLQRASNPAFDAKKRNVSFNSLVRVCLVPSRCEYSPITNELYWGHADYAVFKEDAVSELREYWKEHPTTIKEAITALYQPTFEDIYEHPSLLQIQRDKQSKTFDLLIPTHHQHGDNDSESQYQRVQISHSPMLGLRSRDSVAKFANAPDDRNEIVAAASPRSDGRVTAENNSSSTGGHTGGEVGLFLDEDQDENTEEEDQTDVEEESLLAKSFRNAAIAAKSEYAARERLDSNSPDSEFFVSKSIDYSANVAQQQLPVATTAAVTSVARNSWWPGQQR